MLENHAMETVAAEASTIDERLRGALELVSNDYFTRLASRRLNLWCQSATGGDRTAFESLLRSRGLTLQTAVRSLVQVRWHAERPLPRWARRLNWALTEIGRVESHSIRTDRQDSRLKQVPFWHLFEPLVRGVYGNWQVTMTDWTGCSLQQRYRTWKEALLMNLAK